MTELTIPKHSTENLQQNLKELNNKIGELEASRKKVQKKLEKINNLLPEQDKIWTEHYTKYNEELAKQLEELHGISLTTEEKVELNNNNRIDIQQKSEELQKAGIKIPKNATDFAIISYYAVFSAKSRGLQKPDDLSKIIKNLPIIKEEAKARDQATTQFANQYQEIIKLITNDKNMASAMNGLPDDQLANIEQLKETIAEIGRAPIPVSKTTEELKN